METRGSEMTKLKDKVVGKTKQLVAELIGDGRLREEGKQQDDKAKQEPSELNPFGDLIA
jgi:uncharacterized protein YjbJ (UPF0337 family)